MSNLDFWRKQWSPFRDSPSPYRLMDRMFNDKYFDEYFTKGMVPNGDFAPTVDVSETKSSYLMKFDLPGLKKEDIKVDLHDNQLTVSGERKEEKTTEDKEHHKHISEVSYGSFMRSFTFPVKVDQEKVEAKFENGVLQVKLEKTNGATPRTISVR